MDPPTGTDCMFTDAPSLSRPRNTDWLYVAILYQLMVRRLLTSFSNWCLLVMWCCGVVCPCRDLRLHLPFTVTAYTASPTQLIVTEFTASPTTEEAMRGDSTGVLHPPTRWDPHRIRREPLLPTRRRGGVATRMRRCGGRHHFGLLAKICPPFFCVGSDPSRQALWQQPHNKQPEQKGGEAEPRTHRGWRGGTESVRGGGACAHDLPSWWGVNPRGVALGVGVVLCLVSLVVRGWARGLVPSGPKSGNLVCLQEEARGTTGRTRSATHALLGEPAGAAGRSTTRKLLTSDATTF
jgi:hypothetical protein